MNKNQMYHLEPPYGFMNDPNAFLEFKGTYYLFFQWNPLAKNHSHKDWGYFTSTDLLNWDFQGQAIKADSFYDRDGVYSGTGIVYEDKIYLFYTGNVKPGGKRKTYQSLVSSEDGTNFVKEGILLTTPRGFTEHTRDPKVFHFNNTFYMLLASQEVKGTGSIVLYKSPNPIDFNFVKILATSDEYEMIECPDMAFFEDKAFLCYALQERDNEKDIPLGAKSYYKIVTYDYKTDQLSNNNLDENDGLVDYGFDFYVPQTLKLDDGRVLMVAWMSNMSDDQALVFGIDSFSLHCMTMFREISLVDNRLNQKPIEEYYKLLGKDLEKIEKGFYSPKRQWWTKIDLAKSDNFNLKVNEEIELDYNSLEKQFRLSRINWLDNKKETKTLDLEELRSIEVWNDTSSIEVYLNNGEFALSSRINPLKEDCYIQIEKKDNMKINAKEIEV